MAVSVRLVNTWHERASDVMEAWHAAFGNEELEIAKLGRRYPLAVVSERWGSVEAAGDFLLLRGRDRVVSTLLSAQYTWVAVEEHATAS